jgi:hypothetical protein
MAKKTRRRGKGVGTVYRRDQLWSIAWVANGAKQYEQAFPTKIPHAVSSRYGLAISPPDAVGGRSRSPRGPPSTVFDLANEP